MVMRQRARLPVIQNRMQFPRGETHASASVCFESRGFVVVSSAMSSVFSNPTRGSAYDCCTTDDLSRCGEHRWFLETVNFLPRRPNALIIFCVGHYANINDQREQTHPHCSAVSLPQRALGGRSGTAARPASHLSRWAALVVDLSLSLQTLAPPGLSLVSQLPLRPLVPLFRRRASRSRPLRGRSP